MKQDRDFLDYVNLGSQLAQNAQLESIRGQLGAVGRVEVERLRVEQEEANARRTEATIRDVIFQSEGIVKGLTATHLSTNPRATLVVALRLQGQFTINEITTAKLRSYEDKERLQTLLNALAGLIRECETRLDEAGRDAARTACQYQTEEPELLALIATLERKERIERANEELRSLPPGTLMPKQTAYGIMFFALFPLAVGLLSGFGDPPLPFGLTPFGIAAFLFIVGALGTTESPSERAATLHSQIQHDQALVVTSDADIRRMTEKYGGNTSAALQEVLEKRRSFVKEVQGE